MPAKALILEHDEYDLDHVISDIDEIRRYNMQRYEMEQLTAIVHEDPSRHICVGYKDLTHDEFWVRGHMPGVPLMPGVLMCEAAAQMASYYCQKFDLLGVRVIGFGGLEEVRFREPVLPGNRFVIAARLLQVRRGAMVVCEFQGFVNRSMVCEGIIKGIPLPANFFNNQPSAVG